MNAETVNHAVPKIPESFPVVVHADDHNIPSCFLHGPGSAHRIAHVAADEPAEIRMIVKYLHRQVVSPLNVVLVIFFGDDLHIRIICNCIPDALCPILVTRSAFCSDKHGDFAFSAKLFAQRPGKIGAVFIIMSVSDICDSLASGCCVGTGKGHDADTGVCQLIQHGGNDRLIRHIDADHVILSIPGGGQQAVLLIIGRSGFRRQIFIGDDNPAAQILPLGVLHAHSNRIPPGMNRFIGEIEIVVVFFRSIGIEGQVKPDGRCCLFCFLGAGGHSCFNQTEECCHCRQYTQCSFHLHRLCFAPPPTLFEHV